MSNLNNLPPNIQQLHGEGVGLKIRVLAFLDRWPLANDAEPIDLKSTEASHKEAVNELIIETRTWFNALNAEVSPYLLHDKQFLYYTLREVEASIKKMKYVRPYPTQGTQTVTVVEQDRGFWGFSGVRDNRADIDEDTNLDTAKKAATIAMDVALSLVESVPSSISNQLPRQYLQRGHTPNTAFILMWMDPSHAELDDVSNAIKEVCQGFGIRALRADDVEHQDKITDLILQQIDSSEFLIADLTGERPNVYYEIGYAHATGKRPILYRRHDTKLHFDLSVHNVPEYKNITELRELLTKRFEAILGRKAAKA